MWKQLSAISNQETNYVKNFFEIWYIKARIQVYDV